MATAARHGCMRVQFPFLCVMDLLVLPLGRPIFTFLIFSKDFFDQIASCVIGCSPAIYILCWTPFASIPRTSAMLESVYPRVSFNFASMTKLCTVLKNKSRKIIRLYLKFLLTYSQNNIRLYISHNYIRLYGGVK